MSIPRRVTVVILAGLLACDEPSGTGSTVGTVSVRVVTTPGSLAAIDAGRVIVTGPTTKTVDATPGSPVTIGGLLPGTYTVALQGLQGGEVAYFGQTTNIQVSADHNTAATVSFPPFVVAPNALPASVTGKTFTVSFTSVQNAASYRIEAATDAAFASIKVTQTVQAPATTASITVPDYGTYFVRVRAIDPYSGAGKPSTPQTIELKAPVTLLAPSHLVATTFNATQINLTWDDNATSEEGFKIERCAGAGCTTFAEIASVGINVVSFENSGLTPATSYSYRVRAHDATTSTAYTEVATAVTQDVAPVPPSGLGATVVSATQIDLGWTDNSTNEEGFRIERCAGPSCTSFAEIATVLANVTTFHDVGLTSLTSYSYRVRAYNAVGPSSFTAVASATTQDVPPAAPSGLNAEVRSATQVFLTWTDNAVNEDGFKVEACTGPDCTSFTEMASLEANRNFYSASPLTPATSYSFRVRAFNAVGGSAYSNVATGVLPALPDLVVTSLTHTPANPTSIDLITFTAVVRNDGGSPADASTLELRIAGEPAGAEGTQFKVPALRVGETFTVKRESTLPAQRYRNTATADVTNAVEESDESNNVKTDDYTVSTALADLVISAPATLTVTPTSVGPGGSVTLSAWTLTNQGTVASGNFSVGFYLSTDATITSSDTKLGAYNASLAAGQSLAQAEQVLALPATAPGDFFIGILLDEGNTVTESDEGNNFKSTALTVTGLADLVISAPATLTVTPSTIHSGGNVSLSGFTITNQGTAATSATFNVGYYLSTDATITTSDTPLLLNVTTAQLAAGASTTIAAKTLTIPGTTAPGSYFVGALVDHAGQTAESNEANNFKSTALTVVQPQADLVISAPATLGVKPTSVAAGGTVNLSGWTVSNQGTAPSKDFRDGFYLSADATITASDVLLASHSQAGLAAGASFAWGEPTLTIPATTVPGTYFIGILVDDTNGTSESNEDNNFKSTPLTVVAARPDLVISAPATFTVTPTTVAVGGRVTLPAWTVANQGSAASTDFRNGFYLSTDATITTSDLALATNSNFALAPGASFDWGGPTFTIPSTLTPGNYFIGILVDDLNQTAESNESNNFKSAALTVTGTAATGILRYSFEGNVNNTGALTGFNGTATNVTYVPGKFGQAIKFDGTAGTGASLTGTRAVFATGSKWTISLWYREDVLRPSSHLWSFRGGTMGWETYHGVFTDGITSCSNGGCATFLTPASSVWHNITYRYDGVSSTVGAQVEIYVDGVLATAIANPTLLPLVGTDVVDIKLGSHPSGAFPSVFYVDEFRVYDSVFTPQQQCTTVIGGTWNGISCILP